MQFKIGEYVTRKSYNHDLVFKVISKKDSGYVLKGVEVRLFADSPADDLEKFDASNFDSSDDEFYLRGNISNDNKYFYLPGKILHIDGDTDYLNRSMKYYQSKKLLAVGKKIRESNIKNAIIPLLKKYHPDILIITGHDAYYKKNKDITKLANYKNSLYFIEAIKEARKYESNHEKLIIIAGACQSYFEELIKAGADFASSPKRVNIHALDPAIVASEIALTKKTDNIDLIRVLKMTKYKEDGIGGIECRGFMYVGYPR